MLMLFIFSGFYVKNTTKLTVYADDPCKNIQDLDDKAECYGKEIKEKEEQYQSTSKKLSDIRNQKDSVLGKIDDLLSQLNVTQSQIDDIQAEINEMTATLEEINDLLTDRNEKLEQKITLRNYVIRNYTKRGVLNDLETFLASNNTLGISGLQFSTLSYMYQKAFNEESIRLITLLSTEIETYEKDKAEAQSLKEELESTQGALLAAKTSIENQKNSEEGNLDNLTGKETNYEEELKSLSQKIDDLSSKQQDILKKKAGDGNGSVGDYASPKWSVPKPPFSPAFAAFSYGAYTHYRGMSQYGAKGRAEDGQDYKEIIKFYYDKKVEKDDGLSSKICVEGYGELDFQYYLYGLAEMPADWPKDALKAQAVAARTYANRYKKAGKCICTSQSCQVFLKSKADNPPSRWKEAVDDTKKELISGDSHAMYSSTTGGYISDGIGWDVDGKWPGDAYEKKAGSPWFYWAWYSSNYRFDSDTCGRSHPWLDKSDMADIVNSWVVWRKGSGDERDHISPVTTSCWGGDPYSHDKMAEKADKYGEKYSSVSDVDVDISNDGRTSKVIIQTDKGKVEIDGEEFKTVFNLRAPGYLSIRSRLYELKKE